MEEKQKQQINNWLKKYRAEKATDLERQAHRIFIRIHMEEIKKALSKQKNILEDGNYKKVSVKKYSNEIYR